MVNQVIVYVAVNWWAHTMLLDSATNDQELKTELPKSAQRDSSSLNSVSNRTNRIERQAHLDESFCRDLTNDNRGKPKPAVNTHTHFWKSLNSLQS